MKVTPQKKPPGAPAPMVDLSKKLRAEDLAAYLEAKRKKQPSGEPKKYASGPSGKHTQPGFSFRAPREEVDAITAAAVAAGVTRNDWLREAARAKVGARPKRQKP